MNAMKQVAAVVAATGLLASGSVNATLFDRGGGLLYDNVLNVTWLQDANYASSSGYDADGRMNWSAARTWADNLSYFDSVRGVTWSGWRLPSVAPVNGSSFNYNFSYDGSSDYAYNITSPASELSYMYYVNLGLKGYYSPSGAFQPDFGVFGNGSEGGQADVGLVHNFQSYLYWSGTAYVPDPGRGAWGFSTGGGLHGLGLQTSEFFAWAVRPGDVAVPAPGSLVLLGAGLIALAVVRRRGCFAAS